MRRSLLFAVLALVVVIPAMAADHPQKPGKWQIKMEMDIPGMPMKMPPFTHPVCITEEDLKDPQKAVPGDPKSQCNVGEYEVDGNTVSWTIDCPKQKTKGEGKITYTDDSFEGVMNMTVEEREMSTKYSGKWLGACEK